MREYAQVIFHRQGSSVEFDEAIRERHSTRLFLPEPVPRELLNEALALAQYAPSNSNIQPWHMVFASRASPGELDERVRKRAGSPSFAATTSSALVRCRAMSHRRVEQVRSVDDADQQCSVRTQARALPDAGASTWQGQSIGV
jgi:nitroreductase